MNKLHGFTAEQDYFVTLDYPREVRPETVIARFPCTHSIIDNPVRELQKDIYDVNEGTRVKLCGSYFHSRKLGWDQIGSHEAGFSSSRRPAACWRNSTARAPETHSLWRCADSCSWASLRSAIRAGSSRVVRTTARSAISKGSVTPSSWSRSRQAVSSASRA